MRRKALRRRKNLGDEPNAPSRQQLEEAFNFQRRAMLEPQKEPANLVSLLFIVNPLWKLTFFFLLILTQIYI